MNSAYKGSANFVASSSRKVIRLSFGGAVFPILFQLVTLNCSYAAPSNLCVFTRQKKSGIVQADLHADLHARIEEREGVRTAAKRIAAPKPKH